MRGAFSRQKKDDSVTAEKQLNRIADMNSQSAPIAPFHRSSHTAFSENINPATGRREQVMTVSRLELAWATGELVIKARGSRVVVDADHQQQRGRRSPF